MQYLYISGYCIFFWSQIEMPGFKEALCLSFLRFVFRFLASIALTSLVLIVSIYSRKDDPKQPVPR